MAEIFGSVAGALSVAALFNNCVDSFEYIQLGRHFGRDFERCQLKLDVARVRLGRWGNAVKINEDPRFDIVIPLDKESQTVRAILEEIEQLFQVLQKSSKRYEINATPGDLGCCEVAGMQPTGRSLHNRLAAITTRRKNSTSIFQKAAWALYDAKNFDKLIEQTTGFVDDLEKLSPTEVVRRQLAELEIEEIDNESSLVVLRDAAVDIDYVLSEVVVKKIEVSGGRNRAGDIRILNSARVQVGDYWSTDAITRGLNVVGQTTNEAGSIDAQDSSGVRVGQSYGGRDIFDI